MHFLGGRLFTSTTEVQRVALEEIDLSREIVGKNPSFAQRQTVHFFKKCFFYLSIPSLFGVVARVFFHVFSRICWCKAYSKTTIPQGSSLKTAWKPVPGHLSPKDYCAGRGGKTWFLATLVAPKGTVCAWDIQEDLRKQLEGARAKRTLGELGFEFVWVWKVHVCRVLFYEF